MRDVQEALSHSSTVELQKSSIYSSQYQEWVAFNHVLDQRGPHRNHQTTQAIAEALGCSPHTDSQAPFLEKTPTQLTERGEVELFLT